MLQFQPPGFGQQMIKTSLGVMVYYTHTALPWGSGSEGLSRLPLIFLHSLGGGSSAYEWSKVYPAFAADYRVIAPDLIGWGQSTHPQRDYSAADYLKILTELLEWVGRPVLVVASSLTAGLIIRLATQRPDLFCFLFLVSPSGYADFGADYGQNLFARLAGIPGVDRLLYSLGAANEFAVRNFLEQFLFADRTLVTPEMVAAYLTSAQQFNADYAALASLRGALCFDLSLYLPQLQIPTVLVFGEKSRFNAPSIGRRLASLNPTAIKQVYLLEQTGVLPHLERSAELIGILRKVLHNFNSVENSG